MKIWADIRSTALGFVTTTFGGMGINVLFSIMALRLSQLIINL